VTDAIDDLESMIADALSAAEAMGMLPEIQKTIVRWREQWGGDEVYIARRAHIQRHAKIMDMIEQGLTTAQIAERLGITRQAIHSVRQKRSSFVN
jgi:DNA-binding NarL/FixJ family response regulator